MMEKYGVETVTAPANVKTSSEAFTVGKPVCGDCGGDIFRHDNYCEFCRKVPKLINTRLENASITG